MSPSNLWEQLTELRNTLNLIYLFIMKGRDNGYRWAPTWKSCLGWDAGSGGSPVPSPSTVLPAPPCVHPPGGSWNPVLLGFLWRLPHVGLTEYEFHFQPLSPSWRVGMWAENSKLLIMARSSRGPARTPGAHPESHYNERCRCYPGCRNSWVLVSLKWYCWIRSLKSFIFFMMVNDIKSQLITLPVI